MSKPDNRICFAIQAHNDPDLCERLIRILCQKGDFVILHIDKKANEFRANLTERTRDISDLYVIPTEESVLVNWSGFSQVRATLLLLNHFLQLPPEFRWFSYHSGQDYPIKPIDQYRQFLIEHNPNMLIEIDSNPMLWRCQLYNFFRESPYNRTLLLTAADKVLRNIQQPFVKRNRNIDFKRGASWFTASRETSSRLLNSSTRKWQAVWKYTAAPDEHYFQTLCHLLNIPVITDNYRHIVWKGNASSPELLSEEHLNDLFESRHFFARKFSNKTSRVLDLLDKRLAKSIEPEHALSAGIAEAA